MSRIARRHVPTFVWLALALSAGAQETRDLKVRYAVGDRCLVSVEATVDATLTVTDLEENESTVAYATARKDSFIEEIVHLDDAQLPDQVRIHCRSSTQQRTSAGRAAAEPEKTALHGRIFTVSREGDVMTATPVGGSPLSPDATAALGRWHDLRFLVKDGPTAVGTSWDARAADRLCALLTGGKAAAPRIQCTLTNIAKGPPELAEIAVNVTLDAGGAKEAGGRSVQGTLIGNLQLDLASGKPVSLTLAGTLQASQDFRDPQGNSVGKVSIQARKVEYKIAFEAVQ